MKRIVLTVPPNTIDVGRLLNNQKHHIPIGIVIYTRKSNSKNRSSYALLAKIDNLWGFVDMLGSHATPTYRSNQPLTCIEAAIAANREVLLFDSWIEFAEWANESD